MKLPAESSSDSSIIRNWIKYGKSHGRYLDEKSVFLEEIFKDGKHRSLDLVWDGDGKNDNAALTIFRHFDSASVEKGLIGDKPKTAWILGYSLLERIHYLLVASYDVYGNLGHQFNTRVYMNYLRLEGESRLLNLLPKSQRQRVKQYWYRNTNFFSSFVIYDDSYILDHESLIDFETENYVDELLGILGDHVAKAKSDKFRLNLAGKYKALENINAMPAAISNILPQVSLLLVEGKQENIFTLIHNNAHFNIASITDEEGQRAYSEDTTTLVPGFIGDYPNVIWKLEESELDEFVDSLLQVSSEEDYAKFLSLYGVRRTNPDFWSVMDRVHHLSRRYRGIEHGLLDISRIENR